MLRSALAILLSTAAAGAPDGAPKDSDRPTHYVVRCGVLHVGDGTSMRDAFVVVKDGKIDAIGRGDARLPPDLPVVDARDKVLMPGIVAADSRLSGTDRNEYNVTPDFVAIDGFDFDRDFRVELSGGVTTAYLGTGRGSFVSGQGSVVKLFGDDLVERSLADSCALHVTLGAEANSAEAIFEPTISPTSDDPLAAATRQFPSARISQLATLRMLFGDAARGVVSRETREAFAQNRYDPAPFRAVTAGELPLRVAAKEASDVLRALSFAQEIGAHVVLEDPYEVDRIAGRIARAGAHVVLEVPVVLSGSNPGGEDRDDDEVRNTPENAARLAAAGVPFALTPGRDADLDDFLFVAGIAIRHGLSPDDAMRAITSHAAAALGVDDRVGTLEAGKDADFLVLSGEPFAVGTMVESTWVDGVRAFEREAESDLLAIRAGTILTAAGETIRDGTILVSDGKIRAIGAALALPYGARAIDLPDAVVTPGFIDSFSNLGLADSTGIPDGSTSQLVAAAIRHDDPQFAAARRAGLTTLLVGGRDGRALSGRLAAVKTGAADDASAVLSPIAGFRMVQDVLGADATKAVEDLVKRGKRYIDTWKKYEKELADYEAGKLDAAKETEEKEEPELPAEDDPISGTWECEISGLPIPVEIELSFELKLSGKKVTGKARLSVDGNKLPDGEIKDGGFEDGKLTGSVEFFGQGADLEATVENDTLEGTVDAQGREIEISGKRTAKGAPDDDEDDEDEGPKKPDVDEALEPVRAWLEKKVPAVFRVDRAPAIQALKAYLDEAELPYVLHGVQDAVETPEVLGEGDARPPVILGPTIVRREKGEIVNAAATLADRGIALGFATGDTLGSRYLPLHAAHAIRWGLDPEAALRALTIDAAKMFRIDDRVGSLERGKDADFVAFSGNPFEMTSRVVLVVCNGRVVVDERKNP